MLCAPRVSANKLPENSKLQESFTVEPAEFFPLNYKPLPDLSLTFP